MMHCAMHGAMHGVVQCAMHHATMSQDVVLLAAPVTVNAARWEKVSAIVAGRLINAFVRDNVQLGQLYRIDHLTSQGCCGLNPVPSACVENYDATSHVAADSDAYHFALPVVLESVRLFPTELDL